MSQQLSSSFTFIVKFIFPGIWISGFAIGTIASMVTGSDNAPLFAVITVVGSVSFLLFCIPLKRVAAHDDGIVVSNFQAEERIPYTNIVEVKEYRWINIRPVILYLLYPGRFGHKIMFMPYEKWFLMYWQSHPAAQLLRERTKQ